MLRILHFLKFPLSIWKIPIVSWSATKISIFSENELHIILVLCDEDTLGVNWDKLGHVIAIFKCTCRLKNLNFKCIF